jgi:vacuolar-type H+-ATPase subunit C/Vma6
MKRIFKNLLLGFVAFLGIMSLSSCKLSKANLYRRWVNAGVELPKANVYEAADYNDVKKASEKLNNGEALYVLYAQPGHGVSGKFAVQFNEQAIQYKIDKIYLIESTNMSDKDKTKMEETLGVTNCDTIPAIFKFKKNNDKVELTFDSSKSKYQDYDPIDVITCAIFDRNEK